MKLWRADLQTMGLWTLCSASLLCLVNGRCLLLQLYLPITYLSYYKIVECIMMRQYKILFHVHELICRDRLQLAEVCPKRV